MTIQKSIFLLSISAFVATEVMAQQQTVIQRDSIIKGQTIEITQIYEPEIEQPVKPVLVPTLPPPDTTKPRFQYTVPQQTLSYTYHSVPIRPLALGKQAENTPFQNYLKAGIGNLSSLYLDAGIGSLKGEDFQTAFHISHLSQKGKIDNQKSGITRFDGSGKYFAAGQVFGAAMEVRNRRNRFYGYNNELYDYGSSALQQSFTDGSLNVSMSNAKPNSLHINYQPELAFGMFSDNFSASERRFTFHLPAEYTFGNYDTDSMSRRLNGKISLGFWGNLVHFENSLSKAGNNLVKINPAIDLGVQNTFFHIGLSPAFGKEKTWLLPDLMIRTDLFDNHLKITAGWKGEVHQNTYLDLSLVNPFIDNVFDIRQTHSDQIFAGLESNIGKFITFGGTVSWRQWQNLPLFINDYAENLDGKRFQVIYSPKVQALNLEAYINFQPSEMIALSAKGSWFNYYKTTMDKAFGYPMLNLEGLIDVHALKKLNVHAGFTFMDGIYARRIDGSSHKMPAIFDINAAAEYNIISRFSLFLQANNLLNKNYQRWYQYDGYGINIIGGFRFKF